MSKHLKRLNSSKVLRLNRKNNKWTIKPSPGPHKISKSISLGLIIRDYLKLCDSLKEAKRILSEKEIFVDNKIRTNYKFPCGFMDVITIPKMNKYYRILFDKSGKLTLTPINSSEIQWKLYRIEGKTIIKGKKTQLNLHDGKNIIVEKDEYRRGDVLKIEFKDNKIIESYALTKGNSSMIIGGNHIGEIANINDLMIISSSKSNIAKMKGKNEFLTIQEYVFPIGKSKPIISTPEVKVI